MELLRISACRLLITTIFTLILVSSVRSEPPAKPASPAVADWVKKSNQNARLLVELMAKLQPEAASQFGVEGFDDQITTCRPVLSSGSLRPRARCTPSWRVDSRPSRPSREARPGDPGQGRGRHDQGYRAVG